MRFRTRLNAAALGVLMLLASTAPAVATTTSDSAPSESAFREDTTPPFCRVNGGYVDPVRFVVVGDTQSGLATIRVIDKRLATAAILETERPRDNVAIQVTSLSRSGGGYVILELTDRAGNTATCEVRFPIVRPTP